MIRKLILVVIVSVVFIFSVTPVFSQSLKGLSLGGTTGLITTPTGRIGWEESSDLGIDIGYHFSTNRGFGENESIINIAVSMFKKLEAGLTFDSQSGDNLSDLILFGKFQIFNDGQSGMAVGANLQLLDITSDIKRTFSQVYLASTYSGDFMEIPASTTIVFGKTFDIESGLNDRIDFSMGFDMALFPQVFNGYVRWISEFANYSYSADSRITDANTRGAFNSGLRINILGGSAYKLVIDATLMDVFDEGIDKFTIGGSFGFSLK
ncbi:MAG: hypothetical protein PF693_17460 [Spirochaetia bacterium]|jgi:hypothetical protein|nr:hypothetical protein [Spirochaetia bacterium]